VQLLVFPFPNLRIFPLVFAILQNSSVKPYFRRDVSGWKISQSRLRVGSNRGIVLAILNFWLKNFNFSPSMRNASEKPHLACE
jgi:hypothetical protein